MPRYLVAYYSWTGKTAKVANLIAERLSADLEEIRDAKSRGGLFAFSAAVVASLLQRSSPISPGTKNVADYDIVILGSPVWGSNMATPMRSYILRENPGIKQVGIFCTLGGSGGQPAVNRMAALCGRPSVADLIVNRPAMISDAWHGLTEDFARQIRKSDAALGAIAAA